MSSKPNPQNQSGNKSSQQSAQKAEDFGPPPPPEKSGSSAGAEEPSVVEVQESGPREPKPTPRTVSSRTQVMSKVDDDRPRVTGSRKAHLRLLSIDPWSVTKVTFALSVALGVVITVAVSILWVVLGISGIWDSINSTVSVVLANDADSFDITDYVGYGRVIGLTLLVSAINVILITAIMTIAAYLYNLAAQLVGGVYVTLGNED